MIEKLLNRLETRVGRYRGIRNLTTIIVSAMAITYVADYILGSAMGFYLSGYLSFSRAAILRGQIWRIFTFVLTPPDGGIISAVLQLGFLYFTGNLLQSHWGTLRFNLFYLCGMVGSVIAGFITGFATSYYVNLSVLLAVAILYPQMQVNLYGILPIRMKWMALIDLVMLLPGLIRGPWAVRIAILVSLMNVALFFLGSLMHQFKEAKRRYEWKKNWRGSARR